MQKGFEMAKSRKLPIEILTEQEVVSLIRACSRRAPTGIRNAAMIAVMYRSGLRIGEVLAYFIYVRHCRFVISKQERE